MGEAENITFGPSIERYLQIVLKRQPNNVNNVMNVNKLKVNYGS